MTGNFPQKCPYKAGNGRIQGFASGIVKIAGRDRPNGFRRHTATAFDGCKRVFPGNEKRGKFDTGTLDRRGNSVTSDELHHAVNVLDSGRYSGAGPRHRPIVLNFFAFPLQTVEVIG